MSWALRCFKWIQAAREPMCAKELEIRHLVPHPRRVLSSLIEQNCIELAYIARREKYWRVRPGADPPADLRVENGRKKIHMARRAKNIRRLQRGW